MNQVSAYNAVGATSLHAAMLYHFTFFYYHPPSEIEFALSFLQSTSPVFLFSPISPLTNIIFLSTMPPTLSLLLERPHALQVTTSTRRAKAVSRSQS